ncbi:DNA sulfur modification protein DndD [Halorarum salinum]|uniref:DNA sulfur modification protein DndD n=1 Tax=Halorarum salinum TaxID=2743089 RepID=A0A7D5LBB8_9EURY|nr:DNA sulfur modification protein DndD [Halobaculum salinum]QLG62015.1 DNA sulfur modification protein DndD [Halobaculum salinum]
MKLNKLVITDFGPYRGRNEFDLKTTPESPVILFGGRNGAGKTTLFQGIQICLHGRSALGRRTSEGEYKDLVRSKLHDYPDESATEASIRLEFEYAHMGEVDHYTVTRSWRDRGKSIVENLDVRRNGNLPSDLDKEQWEDFLKELIPPGVSQLFFFDGEKIQELATAIEDDDSFEDSLLSLLGLELVDRLDADLSIYVSQKIDESGVEGINEELNELRETEEEFKQEMADLQDARTTREEELAEVEEKIDSKEAQIAKEGGAYADKREELKDRRVELDTKIDRRKDDIRSIVTGAYPFALAPDLCQSVVDRLQTESEQQEQAAARERLSEELDTLLAQDNLLTETDIPDDASEQITTRIRTAMEDRLVEGSTESKLLHQFSATQRQEMYSLVDQALNDVPAELGEATTEMESMVRERQQIEEKLGRAPDKEVLSPLVDELNDLTERRGALKSELEDLEEEIGKMETKLSRLENQIENKRKEKSEVEGVSERANLANRVQAVLKEYREEIAEEKLRQLESVLSERYLALSNKSEFYDKVVVEEGQLNIFVETIHGNRKPQSDLSAGERQIFATSLLWALAEISGRPLPFIVDTPLGRLDQPHRENLVQNFFPEASHQVLVFSTDTEIDNQHYDDLSESVAQAYHLDYNEMDGCTDVSTGYFWSGNPDSEKASIEGVTQ